MILIFTRNSISLRFRFQNHPHTKGKIGTLICWDQWYPEAWLTALSGSEVLFYPTAIGWHPEEKEQYENQYGAWMNVMKGHGSKWGICCCGKQNWFRAIFT
jgi:N-carbamoylputrescine amidase